MLDERTTGSLHQVASEKTELRMRIFRFQRGHQVRGMQIARGFTGNKIVFHRRLIVDLPIF